MSSIVSSRYARMPDDSGLPSTSRQNHPGDSSGRFDAAAFSDADASQRPPGEGDGGPPAIRNRDVDEFATPEQLRLVYPAIRERRRGLEHARVVRDTVHETIVSSRRIRGQSQALRLEYRYELGERFEYRGLWHGYRYGVEFTRRKDEFAWVLSFRSREFLFKPEELGGEEEMIRGGAETFLKFLAP